MLTRIDPALARRTLRDAVEHVASQLTAGSGIAVSVSGEQEPIGLDHAAREHLLRIAQEAVHNAVKHGAPQRLAITLRAHGEVLSVQDDGKGLDIADMARAVEEGHFGLLGMRERARLMGGTLRIESTPGQGTIITVERSRG